MEKDNIEQFMVDGIEKKISLKEFIRNEMVFIFLTLPCIFFVSKGFFMILTLLPVIFYPISCIMIKKGRAIEGTAYFLHNGIAAVCLSFFFAVVGMAMLFSLFSGRERIATICIVIIGYFVSQYLYFLVIKRHIAKNNHSYSTKMGGTFATLGAVLGISLGRAFLKDLDQDSILVLFCSLFFLCSYLASLGIINFFKYHYVMKHPEILDKKRS